MNAILVSLWAPKEDEPEWPAGRLLTLLALAVATALTAVLFADDVAVVASLTGSLFTMTTSVLFPAVAHWRLVQIFGKDSQSSSQLPHLVIVVFGVVTAVL